MSFATNTPRTALASFAALLLTAAAAPSGFAQDLVVPSGTTFVYNTDVLGQAQLRLLDIQPGGRLQVTGSRPFSVVAAEVRIDGILDASGQDSPGVGTLNTTSEPEAGALGTGGGGTGGIGSPLTTASSPAGLPGLGAFGQGSGPAVGGGAGGEASYAIFDRDARRGAGGGGGALATNQPVSMDPDDPDNIGLVSTAGKGGGAMGLGAISQSAPAAGGANGMPVFIDSNPDNDFWGRAVTPSGIVRGEVLRPSAGRGGGAGGDAVRSDVFPSLPFTSTGDEKGAGGGGGGGIVAIVARSITVGAEGRILANGGSGGGGENTFFFDRVGGGSGGGSGGWIILDSPSINLSEAGQDAFQALGGRGGQGEQNVFDAVGAGGNGGPGVIQVHTTLGTAAELALPPMVSLGDIASPDPKVLLPVLRP